MRFYVNCEIWKTLQLCEIGKILCVIGSFPSEKPIPMLHLNIGATTENRQVELNLKQRAELNSAYAFDPTVGSKCVRTSFHLHLLKLNRGCKSPS
jgi:hypothetical protein